MDARGRFSSGAGSSVKDYRVETSGRVHLPEQQEEQLLPSLRAELAARPGRFDGTAVSSLEELAPSVGVRAVRDEDHVLLVTDREGDTRWTEQTSVFFTVLGAATTDGEVRFRGEDGAEWTYRYTPGGVDQTGVNGFDGSTEPPAPTTRTPQQPPEPPTADVPVPGPSPDPEPVAGPPAGTEPAPPAAEEAPRPPGSAASERGWPPDVDLTAFADEPAPRSASRTVGMVVLLVGGVFLILMIAIMASGIG